MPGIIIRQTNEQRFLFFLPSFFAFRRVIEKDNKYFNFIAKLILNVNLRPTEL